MGVAPFGERAWWTHALAAPFAAWLAAGGDANAPAVREASAPARAALGEAGAAQPPPARPQPPLLLQLVRALAWRTPKRAVSAELDLPAQSTRLHRLTFSTVEAHFYRRQVAECARAAQRGLAAAVWRGEGEAAMLDRLAAPLLRLRQACCHPQVRGAVREPALCRACARARRPSARLALWRGAQPARAPPAAAATAPTRASDGTPGCARARCARWLAQVGSHGLRSVTESAPPLTMGEICAHLLDAERLVCEEQLRRLALNLNALAALQAARARPRAAAAL